MTTNRQRGRDRPQVTADRLRDAFVKKMASPFPTSGDSLLDL